MSESVLLDRRVLIQRGRHLEYFTVAWNLVEGALGVVLGAIAGSISLIGFGLDSFIEVVSGTALLWRMAVDADAQRRELNDTRALRIVGLCFLLLAAYLSYQSAGELLVKRAPERSIPGIVLACASVVIMPILSKAKRKVGRELGSIAMDAEAQQTDFCAYLSLILLVALLMNALFGLWWADSVGTLLMVPIIAKEGLEALRGKRCADCNTRAL